MYNTGDAKLFLVFKDRRIAGRVAVFANRSELEQDKKIRFGFLDFEDDKNVSSLLFEAIEEAAKELNAITIEGPVGFTNLDKAGMLIEGFNEVGTMATWYNYAYYQKHIEGWGFAKKQDWIEFLFKVPSSIPERVNQYADAIAAKHNLRELQINNQADLRKVSVKALKLMSETYQSLYNFLPLTDEQMAFYAEQAINFLPAKNVLVLENQHGDFVAFAVTMPSLVNATKSTNGQLYPFGFLRYLYSMHINTKAELLLIGVAPAYQNKGITAIIFQKLLRIFITKDIKTVESNPEQEDNLEVQSLWKDYESRQHKRRRVYFKKIHD